MSVYRNVFFFRSSVDPQIIFACRAHRGEFNPDKHVDSLHSPDCCFYSNGKREILKIHDTRTGHTYYPDKSCPHIQE